LAAGFNAADIYDDDRDDDWVNPKDWIVTPQNARQIVTKAQPLKQLTSSCTKMEFFSTETGDRFAKPCWSKRCNLCGPVMVKNLQHQIDTLLGDYGYIHRFATKEELNTALARTKKRAQRAGDTFDHVVVGGDEEFGWLTVTTQPIVAAQGLRKVSEWSDRIRHAYLAGRGRLRRTNGFRELSRVAL
jgi:hypothetical protein